MRRAAALLTLVLMASLAATAPAGAKPGTSARSDPARGKISIQGLTLSGTQFGTPTGNPTLVPTDPLGIPVSEGADFTYSSIECSAGPARWNDVGLAFDPDYPGLTDPASIRSVITGTVTKAKTTPSGLRGKVEGTITSHLCVGGEEADQIVVAYKATFRPTSEAPFVGLRGGPMPTTGGLALRGRFRIVEATGRFEDMTGQGSLRGQLTCLQETLTSNDATSCADLGAFSELPFDLAGRYRDPTPGA